MVAILDDSDVLSPEQGIVCRSDEKGAYLFNLDSGELKYVNNVGAIIYKLCDGTRTIAEILSRMLELYPDETMTALKKDVEIFLNALMSAKLLKKII